MSSFWSALRPTRDEFVDAAAVLALTGIALLGFHQAFGGWDFLVVGSLGCAVGVVAAHLLHRSRMPLVLQAVAAVAIFLLLAAPIALRPQATGGVLPSVDTLSGVVDGVVAGWKRLLTTMPPSGEAGNLLAIPYLLGFLGAVAGTALARQPRRLMSLVMLPSLTLVASLLFGTRTPFSVLLQGAVFGSCCIAWMALRKARDRQRYLQSAGPKRLVTGLAMLAVVGLASNTFADHLPFAGANPRYVLRDRTEPPFDPRQFGSPLSAFQRFLIDPSVKDETMFRIDGVPKTAAVKGKFFVRLAVMDDYDGVVWRVSPDAGSRVGARSGRFVRVGESVPSSSEGTAATVSVSVEQLPGPWLPDVGDFTGIEWDGPRASTLRDAFRLSLSTSTGLVSRGGWRPNDSYRFTTVIPAQADLEALTGVEADPQASTQLGRPVPNELVAAAASITQGTSSVLEQVEALQSFFLKGFSASGDKSVDQANAPGHSYARLLAFMKNLQPVGNGEQYAATMAVMARALGIPARVVMGFRVDAARSVAKGSDVYAWVEIGFATGWVMFDVTPDNPTKPTSTTKVPQPNYESQDIPPPPVVPPVPEVSSKRGKEGQSKPEKDQRPESGSDISPLLIAIGLSVGAPLLALALFASAVMWAKHRRRRLRRGRASTAGQIAGGWEEYLDAARDVGLPVSGRVTRREGALLLGASSAVQLASSADGAIFGPDDPASAEVEAFWADVRSASVELRAALPFTRRLRARLSLASLRKNR